MLQSRITEILKICKIKFVPLHSVWNKSNFYKNHPRIQILHKKMQMHQVPVPINYYSNIKNKLHCYSFN
jgi:hypothetical protein